MLVNTVSSGYYGSYNPSFTPGTVSKNVTKRECATRKEVIRSRGHDVEKMNLYVDDRVSWRKMYLPPHWKVEKGIFIEKKRKEKHSVLNFFHQPFFSSSVISYFGLWDIRSVWGYIRILSLSNNRVKLSELLVYRGKEENVSLSVGLENSALCNYVI